jgi:hypothetical protein
MPSRPAAEPTFESASDRAFPLLLIALNALPVYGVLEWGWQSFDLIFLYWLENLIIGVFMLLRMVVRPYRHAVDLIAPLFLAPFFTFHYGMFCLGHGIFVFALFGHDQYETGGLTDVLANIWPVLQTHYLLWAAASLLALQLFDWLRDIRTHGLGAHGVRQLMVAPYRRIIVLHLTLIASGFALAALDEPLAGLLILVVLKTCFDLYHWKKDTEQQADDTGIDSLFDLPPGKLREMEEKFGEPEITVNGEKIRFDSFRELKDSRHMGMLMGAMRLVGAPGEIKLIEQFIAMKIAEENAERPREHAPSPAIHPRKPGLPPSPARE